MFAGRNKPRWQEAFHVLDLLLHVVVLAYMADDVQDVIGAAKAESA
jgi:hypothetical protein